MKLCSLYFFIWNHIINEKSHKLKKQTKLTKKKLKPKSIFPNPIIK
jgi:hypothetical protein